MLSGETIMGTETYCEHCSMETAGPNVPEIRYTVLAELVERENMKVALRSFEKYDPSESKGTLESSGFGPKYSKTELEELEGLKTALGKLDEYCILDGPVTDHKNQRFIMAYEGSPGIIKKGLEPEHELQFIKSYLKQELPSSFFIRETPTTYEIERPLTNFVFVVDASVQSGHKRGKGPHKPLGAVMKTLLLNYGDKEPQDTVGVSSNANARFSER